jgi:hypothetical protein
MALKNYTSTVSAMKSIGYIERKLVSNGARQIMKEYDSVGRAECISFVIEVKGRDVPFKLPAKIDACERVLLSMRGPRAREETLKKVGEQAERTAWKILSDWVDAQMAMIELAQVEVLEVFMPYIYDPAKRQTLFEVMKEKGFRGFLPAPKG